MVVLSNVEYVYVERRISSGDADAPLSPPLTADEIELGGRLEQFWLVTAIGDDKHSYQWTFPKGTTKADAKASVKAWFAKGKGDTVSPMTSAVDTPPLEEWTV